MKLRERINRIRELSVKRDELLDDLERSLQLEEFSPEAFASGKCSVSMRCSQSRGLNGWISRRADYVVTINGVDHDGVDLPDTLWGVLMEGSEHLGWNPRSKKGGES